MKKVIIFGLDQFAEMIFELLCEEGHEIVAFTVDKTYCKDKEKFSKPIVPFEELESLYVPEEHGIIFCIGYTDMNRLREKRMNMAMDKGYEILSYKHPTAIVQAKEIGYGNIFMEGSIIGQGCKIGNGNIFWPMAHVAHHTTVQNYCFFTISCSIAGNILIKDYCVFGNNCTIKNGIEIGEGCLIGAGAYISKSTEDWSVYTPPRSYKLEGKSSLDFKL